MNQTDNHGPILARQLKRARQHRKWSLELCATHTGVSKAMLGQIERGESSPTVATLWKIATGFTLPLSYFLLTPGQDSGVEVPDDTAFQIQRNLNDLQIKALLPFDSITRFELFQIVINPGYSHLSLPHNHGVIEHIVVISGAIEYLLNDNWLRLTAGQVARFCADQPHGYRNVTQQTAVFHNLIFYGESYSG
ncbi:helix-turn-helix domain-containing protein [Pseudoalteromonas tunicata]|uniref:helix-turn-helix domain-containing protein n=1 Tax=Pseudoalteromonas tunicata TaxID=314281 RepID=UPI00273F333A|nr:helix-turn-helix domain-containing protein [Pseudoalteromonas tunicata]MDP5214456.1 helix-turn-helix domain-containing protein [Pseudoalteromonas tunicata]